MARIARCTEPTGIPVPAEMARTLRPAFQRSSTTMRRRAVSARVPGRVPERVPLFPVSVGLAAAVARRGCSKGRPARFRARCPCRLSTLVCAARWGDVRSVGRCGDGVRAQLLRAARVPGGKQSGHRPTISVHRQHQGLRLIKRAMELDNAGRYTDAEPLYKQSLAIRDWAGAKIDLDRRIAHACDAAGADAGLDVTRFSAADFDDNA
jgi:hypothetical protein